MSNVSIFLVYCQLSFLLYYDAKNTFIYIDSPNAHINSTLHVVTKGGEIKIFCFVDGNPLLPNNIIWKLKEKSLLSRDSEYYNVQFIPPNLSVLTIFQARDVDDGNVSCSVSNGIGVSVANAYTELRVKRAPQLLADESVLKAGEDSNFGRSARFKIAVSAYPDASFKWKTPV